MNLHIFPSYTLVNGHDRGLLLSFKVLIYLPVFVFDKHRGILVVLSEKYNYRGKSLYCRLTHLHMTEPPSASTSEATLATAASCCCTKTPDSLRNILDFCFMAANIRFIGVQSTHSKCKESGASLVGISSEGYPNQDEGGPSPEWI